jgi:excisionase family DNA binding protein
MKVHTIPAEVLTAIVALLAGCVPDLTPTRFVAALQSFEPDNDEGTDRPPPPRMLSLEQTAKALDVSVCTLRRMVKDGRLPGRKVGGQWRVPLSAVKALAEVGGDVR